MSDEDSIHENAADNNEEHSEDESHSNNWDSDCRVVVNHTVKSIDGVEELPVSAKEEHEPPVKKFKISMDITNEYTNEKFLKSFKQHWDDKEPFSFNNSELIVDPFKVCMLKDFLENKNLLSKIRKEFNDVEWHKRNMDLYEFFQSADLKHLGNFKYISLFYKFLEENVMKWISSITGVELVKVSATCSLYGDTDYLLVHDDHQDDRMVAFILYLTDVDWNENFGGSLQLFDKDENGQPSKVVRDIFPSENQFIFFQVTNGSYHQVSEVTCKNNCRLSINGWFHSNIPPTFEAPIYHAPTEGIFSKNPVNPKKSDIDLSDWISEEYLDRETVEEIQAHIEENSEISLQNYFKQVVVQTVLDDLQSEGIKWTQVGPPNRFSYLKLEENDLPQTLERLLLLFKSEGMFKLLKKYTDLDLKCLKYEMQKWTPGSYVLLSDYDWSEKNELDLILYFGCSDVGSLAGGRTMYVSDEDEIQQALITVEPQENSLNIIYRDTARFTKYFSKQSNCKVFYMLICSYSE